MKFKTSVRDKFLIILTDSAFGIEASSATSYTSLNKVMLGDKIWENSFSIKVPNIKYKLDFYSLLNSKFYGSIL